MSRIHMITRTIQATKATVMCVDTETAEVTNETVIVPRTHKDEAALLKAVSKLVNTGSIKAVAIVDTEVTETLYGMTEEEFVKNAKPLPPRKEADSDEAV